VRELKSFISDQILPQLVLEDMVENNQQAQTIDQEILNISFTVTTLENEL